MSLYVRYQPVTLGGGGGSGGVNTIGTFDSQTPSPNGLTIVGSTLYAQSASASDPGMVNIGAQTFGGAKTFLNLATFSDGEVVYSDPSTFLNQTWIGPGSSGYETWYWKVAPSTITLSNPGIGGYTFATDNTGSSSFNALPADLGALEVYGKPSKAVLVLQNSSTSPGNLLTGFASNGSTVLAHIDNAGNIFGNNLSGTNTGDVTLGTANGLSIATGQVLSLGTASTSTTGALTSTDWNTFNSKQAALTFTAPLVNTSGTITITQSGTSSNGYLSSTDWNTFNGKQAAGSYITALTGDGTASGPDSAALTLASVNSNIGSFTNASITVNAKGLVTAASSGTAPVTSLTIASSNGFAGSSSGGATPSLTLSTTITGVLKGNGTAISAATAGTDYVIPSGSITGTAGNITASSNSTLTTLSMLSLPTSQLSGSIALSQIASIASDTILGNNTGGSATPTALTVSQVNTLLGTLTNPMTTLGDSIYGGASGTPTRIAGQTTSTINFLAQTGTGSASAAPVWTAFTAPTVQAFTSTGSQAGIVITLTTTTITATAGAVYTNNSNSYTLLNTVSTATTGIFFSGTGATSGTTFTKSSGTGPSTIVANAASNIQTLATYTTPTSPRTPLWLKIKQVAGGGGGGGSGTTTTGGTGGTGGTTTFGTFLIYTQGGNGGSTYSVGGPGLGGGSSVQSGATAIFDIPGSGGQTSTGVASTNAGGGGGASPFGGAAGSTTGGSANTAQPNSGSGGSGGPGSATALSGGCGGGAGGYAEANIYSPASTYYYSIGAAGGGGSAGSGSGATAGGQGGSGYIVVEEYYQ